MGPRKSTRMNKPSHGQTRFNLSEKTYNYRYYIFYCLLFQPFAEAFMKDRESQNLCESPFERGSRIQMEEEFNKKKDEEQRVATESVVVPLPSSNQKKKGKQPKAGCGCVGSEKTPRCSTAACRCRKGQHTCSQDCKCKGQCANGQKPEATPEELTKLLQSLKEPPAKKTKAAKNKKTGAT